MSEDTTIQFYSRVVCKHSGGNTKTIEDLFNRRVDRALYAAMRPFHTQVKARVSNERPVYKDNVITSRGRRYNMPTLISGSEQRPWMRSRGLQRGIKIYNDKTDRNKHVVSVVSEYGARQHPFPYGRSLNEGFRPEVGYWKNRRRLKRIVKYPWWDPVLKSNEREFFRRFEQSMGGVK